MLVFMLESMQDLYIMYLIRFRTDKIAYHPKAELNEGRRPYTDKRLPQSRYLPRLTFQMKRFCILWALSFYWVRPESSVLTVGGASPIRTTFPIRYSRNATFCFKFQYIPTQVPNNCLLFFFKFHLPRFKTKKSFFYINLWVVVLWIRIVVMVSVLVRITFLAVRIRSSTLGQWGSESRDLMTKL
jgi:hypothetical protein